MTNITYFPKVLLLGHQFDNRTGLGITLANLFADWPKENMAIMAPIINVDLCEVSRPCYLYLGKKEKISIPPRTGIKGKVRNTIRKWYYLLGLNEKQYKFRYSPKDIKEVQTFNPDIIFCCLGSLNSMKDCLQILSAFPIAKLVLYIVDDWVNTKENNRLFSGYWRKKNDKFFRILLDKAAGLLSICPYMSEVYGEKYQKKFIPFHNPVDVSLWNSINVTKKYEHDTLSILYVGKINDDTRKCLLDVATTIMSINSQKDRIYKYVFDVYTPNYLDNTSLFNNNPYCNIFPPVPHSDVPVLTKRYNSLLLTLGFSPKTREYVRLSMPTKLSEYLAAGIPTILYCPEEIALVKYLRPCRCTINCFKRNINELKDTIIKLEDDTFCKTIVANSLSIAVQHDIHVVRKQFENTLQNFLPMEYNQL